MVEKSPQGELPVATTRAPSTAVAAEVALALAGSSPTIARSAGVRRMPQGAGTTIVDGVVVIRGGAVGAGSQVQAAAASGAVGAGDHRVDGVDHELLLWCCQGVAQSAPRTVPSAQSDD